MKIQVPKWLITIYKFTLLNPKPSTNVTVFKDQTSSHHLTTYSLALALLPTDGKISSAFTTEASES